MSVILSKKTDYDIKIRELEKKITNHKHERHITTPEFNKLTAENFAVKLKQVNLITKTDFDAKLQVLIKKLLQIKLSIYLLKMNWKN